MWLECLSKPRCADPQLCMCSICRKVGGYGGSVNLGGHYDTLKIEGKENIRCVPPEQKPPVGVVEKIG